LAFQARQIALRTAAQIIKDANLRLVMEVFGDVPADEARASRNSHWHTGIKQSGASIQRPVRRKGEIPTGRSISRFS